MAETKQAPRSAEKKPKRPAKKVAGKTKHRPHVQIILGGDLRYLETQIAQYCARVKVGLTVTSVTPGVVEGGAGWLVTYEEK